MDFAQKRERRELRHALWVAAMGARGKDTSVKKQLKELDD